MLNLISSLLILSQTNPAPEIKEAPRTISTPTIERSSKLMKGSRVVYIQDDPVRGSATQFIIDHILQLENLISPQNHLSEKELVKRNPQIRKIVSSVLDVGVLGQEALSAHWAQLEKSAKGKTQRERYQQMFKNLVEENYLVKIRHYINGEHQIHFTSELVTKGDTKVLAKIRKKDVDVLVEFDVLKRGADWKVVDTKLDETSLQDTYRSSFNRIIRKNGGLEKGFPELLKAMDKRLAELRGGKAKQL